MRWIARLRSRCHRPERRLYSGLRLAAPALVLCLVLLLAGGVMAQGGYDLTWWTADGGGSTFSTGPGYSLGGTIGQPDAGVLAGPGYTLSGGFWSGAPGRPSLYRVYVPLVVRGYR